MSSRKRKLTSVPVIEPTTNNEPKRIREYQDGDGPLPIEDLQVS